MAGPSVTYTFTNSTTADGTQVSQNFTDLINGCTDGTKDFSINALTCAGAATFNGNVTIGNASGDDLTITASLASTVNVKTTNTYDFGSATIAMRSFYIAASDGAARSIRLLAGAVSASYTLTFPTAAPTNNKSILTLTSAGVGSFEHRSIQTTTSLTNASSPYTVLQTDELILCNAASGAITLNLPAASSSTGKTLRIKKTDTSLANAVTLDGNSSETIDGATTTTLNTQYETVEIVCDGSNWHITQRLIPSGPTSYTPTFTGLGTVTVSTCKWWRNGRFIKVIGSGTAGTVTADGVSATLPSGLTSNSTDIDTGGTAGAIVGMATHNRSTTLGAANFNPICVRDGGASTVVSWTNVGTGASVSNFAAVGGSTLYANSSLFSFEFEVPITGWKD